MNADEPAPIPTRTAYTLSAATCYYFARQLRQRDPRLGARRNRGTLPRDPIKVTQSREDKAKYLDAAGHRLEIESRKPHGGAGVDAAVLGYLLAYLSGNVEVRKELVAELQELGRSVALDWNDPAGVAMAVIGE